MENRNDWYDDIIKEIDKHKDKFLSKKDYKKYKLDLLLRVAKRVASFSADCDECQKFQGEIKKLAEGLGNLVQSSKEERNSYFKIINNVVKHLCEHHKLIREGSYIGIGAAIGLLGLPIGVALDNVALGPGFGLPIGVAIGAAMEAKAKKEGRVI